MTVLHSRSVVSCLLLLDLGVGASSSLTAARAPTTCSGSVLQDTGLNGKTLEKLSIPGGKHATTFCCAQCGNATNCDAWVVESNRCYLRELRKDNQHMRSNIKGSACVGRVNTGFNTGKVYKHAQVISAKVAEQDSQCCASCNADAACDGWQIVTNAKPSAECQLLRLTNGKPGRQSGLSPESVAPHFEGTCNVVAETQGLGTFVAKHPLVSKSQEDQDGECCAYCAKNTQCDFWVRDTMGNPNWCRLMSDWKRSAEWKTRTRTGFKVGNAADAMYCRALDFMWRIAGDVLKRVTFTSIRGVKDMKVELGPSFHCEKLSFVNNQVIGNLYDVQFGAFMGLDGSIEGINGNASLYVRADPNVVIDFNKCDVPTFRTNDWNDGFGIDGNTGAHQKTTNGGLLSGSFHSNLRRAGCAHALVGQPNFEPFNSAGKIGSYHLSGDTHYENDYECCSKCQGVADCDAWRTSKGYVDSGRQCTLHSFWAVDNRYNGNWKGLNVSRMNYKGRGNMHSLVDVAGDTEEERDAACADLCVSDEKCDLWTHSRTDRKCMLQGALRNSGWVGVGRGVVNLIVDALVHMVFSKLVKHICGLGGVKAVLKILEALEHWTMTGDSFVSLDVPYGFWDSLPSEFWKNQSWYASLNFPSNVSGLDSIRADQAALGSVVNEVVSGLAEDFSSGNVAEQSGTPVAFYVGSLIKECVETGCKSGQVTLVV